jgi:chorismate lyase/3-hydroxybenzoate synthase
LISTNTACNEVMPDASRHDEFVVPLITSGTQDIENGDSTPIFSFRFAAAENQITDAGQLTVALQPIDQAEAVETWVTQADVSTGQLGDVYYSKCADYLFASIAAPLSTDMPTRQLATKLYEEVLSAVTALDYPHLLRSWNYFPHINTGLGDSERYRQFCIGRADAFRAAGVERDTFPAGTAIGTHDGTLMQVVMLAGRSPARMIENSRQTSAYQYPRRYGPVSPSFARASRFETLHAQQLFVSGTASIVESESCHIGDVQKQLDETLKNIHVLLDNTATTQDSSLIAPLFRIYLRHDADTVELAQRIREEFGQNSRTLFLRSDICRAELDIEIECVFWTS